MSKIQIANLTSDVSSLNQKIQALENKLMEQEQKTQQLQQQLQSTFGPAMSVMAEKLKVELEASMQATFQRMHLLMNTAPHHLPPKDDPLMED